MKLPSDIRDILLAKLRGEITPVQQEILDSWLDATPGNRESAREFVGDWMSYRWAGKMDQVSPQRDWDMLLARVKKTRRLRIGKFVSLAAACCVAVVSIFVFNIKFPSDRLDVITPSVGARLTLSTGEEFLLDENITFTVESDVVAVMSDGTTTYQAPVSEGTGLDCVVDVPLGCDYRLTLPDGTAVVLNAGSSIRFPGRFPRDQRRVMLEGEAYLDVTKDPERPFIVGTRMAEVEVLGTSFNLSAYDTDRNTVVTLVEGMVKVRGGKDESVLVPGRQWKMDHETGHTAIREVDTDIYTSWVSGLFRFEAMPLERLMANLHRCFGVEFQFEDDVAGVRFTGGFRRQDDLKSILEMLTAANDVSFEIKNNKVVISKKYR